MIIYCKSQVINYGQFTSPIMIEVKYKESPRITHKDLIVTEAKDNLPNLVITKNYDDFGLSEYENKKIYKIPAFVFLYLIGYVEAIKYN